MQNRKFFATLTAAIALTAGLASCSNNDDELNPKNEGRIPITLTSNVGSRATDQSLQETQIANGVNVGVFITQGDNSIATNNMLASDGNGGFTGNAGSTNDAETNLDIYAYAPYNSAWGDLSTEYTFTVTDQETNDKYYAADLMIAEPVNTAPTVEAINLTFKHKMAKLNLNFDLTGAPETFSLDGATVSVLNVLPSVNVKVSDGTIGTASGSATAIKAGTLTAEGKASVVFPPQTIAQDTKFVQVVVNGQTYEATLPSAVAFEGGKKYTYTVTFTADGDGGSTVTGITLTPTTSVTPWEDGQLKSCNVGDYVTKTGEIVPKEDIASYDNKADIVAVIFSKEVSELDKRAGYNAYAMGLTVGTGLVWGEATLVGTSVETFGDALNDLDGRDKTNYVLKQVSGIGTTDNTIFKYCVDLEDFDSSVASEWFVPSIGQMLQFLNGIGQAGINADTELAETGYTNAMYRVPVTEGSTTVLDNLNACATAVGKSEIVGSGSQVFVTVTESNAYKGSVNFWCFQTNFSVSETSYSWGFGRNPGKGSTSGRYLLPCVALTLSSSTSISATAQAN